jgi:hypothetical protein
VIRGVTAAFTLVTFIDPLHVTTNITTSHKLLTTWHPISRACNSCTENHFGAGYGLWAGVGS